MKVLLLNKSDTSGGAARAVYRIHNALLDNSIDSRMRVGVKKSDDHTVKGPESIFEKGMSHLKVQLSLRIMKLQLSKNYNPHSAALFSSGLVSNINKSDFDVVQLNWICGEFLSVEDIGNIEKPLVWRLSDMWPFCGTEHYCFDGPSARWRNGYNKENCPKEHEGIDIDRWVWNRKKRSWSNKIHIVTPSQWMADCVKSSYLMNDYPVSVIPTPLNMNRFKPWDKEYSREILGLPKTKLLILFGAVDGTKNRRKGSDLLLKAVSKINDKDVEGVIFGQNKPLNKPDFDIPIHWMGRIKDNVTLSLLYSAADIMAVPSRQDNLPQTAIEAQSCGCPVIAFDVSGMPDALLHKKTGYLAEAFDTDDFAVGINWVLHDTERRNRLSKSARKRALSLWNRKIVVEKYLEVYRKAIS